MKITTDLNMISGIIMSLAFGVNIIVQITKNYIPIPTKIWCIIVSFIVCISTLFTAASLKIVTVNVGYIIISLMGSFITAFISMYGFDTLSDLWKRFKKGEKI